MNLVQVWTRVGLVFALSTCVSAEGWNGSRTPLPYSVQLDAEVFSAYPRTFERIVQPGIPSDASGLIGRNREWGRVYSARFQLSAGQALRFMLWAENVERARLALSAIEIGANTIRPDGELPSSLPPDRFPNLPPPSEGDIASGAAFFLGDACLGLMALETSPLQVGSIDARLVLLEKLGRASRWLVGKRAVLERYDARAPNRLLFDALAYQACGALFRDEEAMRLGASFTELALFALHTDGYFLEGGGWDTGYQAVSLYLAHDLMVAGARAAWRARVADAARWLARRVDRQGRVDSNGNTRTCGGGEAFLGEAKRLAVPTVVVALAAAGVREQDADLKQAAERVVVWLEDSPRANPCFP
jgi:hypothetical protein